jgi:antitoxin component YwqK of YwqJK toxin-antitoxin module
MRLTLTASLLLAFFACSHANKDQPKTDGEGLETSVEVNGDELVRTFDLNRDGKADDWKHYKLLADLAENGKPREQLTRREMDTNFDGKVDLITWFDEEGRRVKESFDLDFDGKPDVIVYYDKGVVTKKETYHSSSGDAPDTVAYYEGGRKVRVERSLKVPGKVDTWEYFENGRLTRVGEDVDGDGLVDRWAKAKEPEEEEQPKKAPAKK